MIGGNRRVSEAIWFKYPLRCIKKPSKSVKDFGSCIAFIRLDTEDRMGFTHALQLNDIVSLHETFLIVLQYVRSLRVNPINKRHRSSNTFKSRMTASYRSDRYIISTWILPLQSSQGRLGRRSTPTRLERSGFLMCGFALYDWIRRDGLDKCGPTRSKGLIIPLL